MTRWKADSVDRATQVMKLVVSQEATQGRAASCQRLAEALADAGLLAADGYAEKEKKP